MWPGIALWSCVIVSDLPFGCEAESGAPGPFWISAYFENCGSVSPWGGLLIKESVNLSVNNMGFTNSLRACFTLHELNHAHWAEIHENKYPAVPAR
jgi:hypothetical protein